MNNLNLKLQQENPIRPDSIYQLVQLTLKIKDIRKYKN